MDKILFLRWLNEKIDYFEDLRAKCTSDYEDIVGNVVAKATYDGLLLFLEQMKGEILSDRFNKKK